MNHAKYVNVYTVLIDTYLFILMFFDGCKRTSCVMNQQMSKLYDKIITSKVVYLILNTRYKTQIVQ